MDAAEVGLMTLPDPRLLNPQARARLAWRVHETPDFELPPLTYFNSAPCTRHQDGGPRPGCPACGIRLRRHQRAGAAWAFVAGKGLLADSVGTGKTAQVAAMLAMCAQTGELGPNNRAVVVCKAAAVLDPWAKELRRLLPRLNILAATGTPAQRVTGYLGAWDIAIVSDRTFAPARGQANRDGDVEVLRQLPVGIVIYDDADAMRNHSTATAYAVKRLAAIATRVLGVHGTPLQKRLVELHSFLEPIGGRTVLGSLPAFRSRYVSQKPTYFYQIANVCADGHLTPPPYRRCTSEVNGVICGKPCRRDKTNRKVLRKVMVDSGVVAERLPEFRQRIAPLILRRTAAELDDTELPDIIMDTVWVPLLPAQKTRYAELRTGVLRRLRNGAEEVTHAEAAAAFTRGWQICSGLASLDENNDVSAKLDWVTDKLTGDMENDRVVVFVYFRQNVRALASRLTAAGVSHGLFWSEETDKRVRARTLDAFRAGDTRVLIGTTALETSLNLQCANRMLIADTVLNQARFEQLIGRVRRQGSEHSSVWVSHLLSPDTQEAGYTDLLQREAAMAAGVWQDNSSAGELFGLSPAAVMRLIAHGQV